ncbi:MAG: hypothetical protein DI586_10105 [Micavibrio aeruginosavorus]|uniref:Uncharacterized protein n=1 Tax=Micavibrio aeruginosavorus TaxID=349221 RepID=A0A2W5FH30_9BACT|nr:MAG: hypothetical protein DI586_10105 [Micavibrio aeruginosavorus]
MVQKFINRRFLSKNQTIFRIFLNTLTLKKADIMKKKILIVTEAALENPQAKPLSDLDRARVNGVYRTYENLMPHLQEKYDVDFLTPFSYGEEAGMIRAIWRRNTRFSAPMQKTIPLVVPSIKDMASRIEAIAPDFIHIATEGPLGIAALYCARKKGIQVSTAFHTNWQQYVTEQGFDIPFVPNAVAGRVVRKLLTVFHGKADATMAATNDLRHELIEWGMKQDKIHIVSRGIDTNIFHPYKDSPKDYILYVGRLAPGKGAERFCELETGSIPKVVVGTGPSEERIKATYPDVKFLGFAEGEQLARLYSGAKLFVLPSDTETFGMTVIEALACGTPVVALNRGGHQPILNADSGLGVMASDLQEAYDRAISDMGQFKSPEEMADLICKTRSWSQEAENFSSMMGEARNKTSEYLPDFTLAAA